MKIKDTYKSIKSNSEGHFKDKGSKFIAFAYPVTSEEEVKEHLQHLKKEHYSARHHCYAYRLGFEGENYRVNDDGEPTGTAGRPILGQLLSNELTNVLIVVVRYFGGTLLGVGGLINAYKNATIDAIGKSFIVTHVIENDYLLEFDYPLQNKVMRVMKDDNIEIRKSTFELNCRFEIGIRLNIEELVLAKFSKIEGLKITQIS